ncbi:hypothetical protein Gogos_011931, partial [Gossypium gossypioides]|nr:hypothetical protein [Gossypium gossypioides]
RGDEISLLEELVQISVKSSLVAPNENPSLICSDEEDLELILEGCPWFFQRQLIIFDKLTQYMQRSKIRLVLLLFWLQMGSCLPECDKKDLMHVVGSTFRGVKDCTKISSEERERTEDDLPYSIVLKAESNLLGKENQMFGFSTRKLMKQRYYTRDDDVSRSGDSIKVAPESDQKIE